MGAPSHFYPKWEAAGGMQCSYQIMKRVRDGKQNYRSAERRGVLMTTPIELRRIRLENDYASMKRVRCSAITWTPLKGKPPYVEDYRLTIKVNAITAPKPRYRKKHYVRLTLPPTYPSSPPLVSMMSTPAPYHPNWYTNGVWCFGEWLSHESLGEFVVRMVKSLQYQPGFTSAGCAANSDALEWYAHGAPRSLFPTDTSRLPDPT
jgi:ubiquitin-protein ligase